MQHLLRLARWNAGPALGGHACVELLAKRPGEPGEVEQWTVGPRAFALFNRSGALTRIHADAVALASRTGTLVATFTAVAADKFVSGGI